MTPVTDHRSPITLFAALALLCAALAGAADLPPPRVRPDPTNPPIRPQRPGALPAQPAEPATAPQPEHPLSVPGAPNSAQHATQPPRTIPSCGDVTLTKRPGKERATECEVR